MVTYEFWDIIWTNLQSGLDSIEDIVRSIDDVFFTFFQPLEDVVGSWRLDPVIDASPLKSFVVTIADWLVDISDFGDTSLFGLFCGTALTTYIIIAIYKFLK